MCSFNQQYLYHLQKYYELSRINLQFLLCSCICNHQPYPHVYLKNFLSHDEANLSRLIYCDISILLCLQPIYQLHRSVVTIVLIYILITNMVLNVISISKNKGNKQADLKYSIYFILKVLIQEILDNFGTFKFLQIQLII